MGNKLQRLIYCASATTPLLFVLTAVWHLQHGGVIVPACFVGAGIILGGLLYASFGFARKSGEFISFHATEIKPTDGQIFAYIVAYLLPCASIIIKDYSLPITAGLAIIVIFTAIFINASFPHPLLFLIGYHFYIVNSASGVSDYLLISKRVSLRNKTQVKSVRRWFEYLLVEG